MSEQTFTYKAENGNICEIADTFAEMLPMLEISPQTPPFFSVEAF